jgi:HD-like signal output (HDOD) protein/CheY-like chemotaxis protein
MANAKQHVEETTAATDYSVINGARILVVDDTRTIRRLLVNTLKGFNAYVEEADDGNIALTKMQLAVEQNTHFDIIILDLNMPGMGGIQFLETLRTNPDLSHTIVIILSSESGRDMVEQCARFGISGYIFKPPHKKRILDTVTKALKGKKSGMLKEISDKLKNVMLEASQKAILNGESNATKPEDNTVYRSVMNWIEGGAPSTEIDFKKPEINNDNSEGIIQFVRNLEKNKQLPTLPPFVNKIKDLVSNPAYDSERIADLIQDYPTMINSILRIANSPIYNLKEPIRTLEMAITRLGFKKISDIALYIGAFSCMYSNKSEFFDPKQYWTHCIHTGIAANVINGICKREETEEQSTESLHLTGLLHDIGKLMFLRFSPEKYFECTEQSKAFSTPLYIIEQSVYGVNHAEIGEWIAGKWGLTPAQLAAIRYHHTPHQARDHKEMAKLCHLANYICNDLAYGNAGDAAAPVYDRHIWNEFGITKEKTNTIKQQIEEYAKHLEFLVLMY